MVRVNRHQFSKFLHLTLLLLAFSLLPSFGLLPSPPLELMIHLGLQFSLERFEFEGVLKALRIYSEVGLFQRMERVMEQFVLLAASLDLCHQFFLLLLCGFMGTLVQYVRQLLQQLQKFIIIEISGGRAYPYIDVVQLLLGLWFFGEELVLLEEMDEFLVVHGLGLMLNPLEALLDTRQVVLASVVFEDQLQIALLAISGCFCFGLGGTRFALSIFWLVLLEVCWRGRLRDFEFQLLQFLPIDLYAFLNEFGLFGIAGALIQYLLQVLDILLIGLPEHRNPMLVHELIIQNGALPQLLSQPDLLLGCFHWFRLVLYSDGFVGIEPILQIFLHLFQCEGDPVEIKLAFFAIRSGPVILLNDLLSMRLALVLLEIVLPLSSEPNLLKFEHVSEEGMQISGRHLPVLPLSSKQRLDLGPIQLDILSHCLHYFTIILSQQNEESLARVRV